MKIEVYTKSYCPYCKMVTRYLSDRGQEFDEIEVSDKPEVYRDLKKTTGHQTVPQVFINGEFIGGADDFFANKENYKL